MSDLSLSFFEPFQICFFHDIEEEEEEVINKFMKCAEQSLTRLLFLPLPSHFVHCSIRALVLLSGD